MSYYKNDFESDKVTCLDMIVAFLIFAMCWFCLAIL